MGPWICVCVWESETLITQNRDNINTDDYHSQRTLRCKKYPPLMVKSTDPLHLSGSVHITSKRKHTLVACVRCRKATLLTLAEWNLPECVSRSTSTDTFSSVGLELLRSVVGTSDTESKNSLASLTVHYSHFLSFFPAHSHSLSVFFFSSAVEHLTNTDHFSRVFTNFKTTDLRSLWILSINVLVSYSVVAHMFSLGSLVSSCCQKTLMFRLFGNS